MSGTLTNVRFCHRISQTTTSYSHHLLTLPQQPDDDDSAAVRSVLLQCRGAETDRRTDGTVNGPPCYPYRWDAAVLRAASQRTAHALSTLLRDVWPWKLDPPVSSGLVVRCRQQERTVSWRYTDPAASRSKQLASFTQQLTCLCLNFPLCVTFTSLTVMCSNDSIRTVRHRLLSSSPDGSRSPRRRVCGLGRVPPSSCMRRKEAESGMLIRIMQHAAYKM